MATNLPPKFELKTTPAPGDKARYEAPVIRTESLTAVAALCNGTAGGGRKATAPTCNATKLKS